GYDCAGAEDGGHAGLLEGGVVGLGNDAAANHENVFPARFAQLFDQVGDESAMGAGEGRDADDMYVVVDGLLGGLGGRGEERADVDVEADVGKGGSDDLHAAVVSVLAELGDEDARAASFSV